MPREKGLGVDPSLRPPSTLLEESFSFLMELLVGTGRVIRQNIWSGIIRQTISRLLLSKFGKSNNSMFSSLLRRRLWCGRRVIGHSPNVPHSVESLEDCAAVDIFSPVRRIGCEDDAYLRGDMAAEPITPASGACQECGRDAMAKSPVIHKKNRAFRRRSPGWHRILRGRLPFVMVPIAPIRVAVPVRGSIVYRFESCYCLLRRRTS